MTGSTSPTLRGVGSRGALSVPLGVVAVVVVAASLWLLRLAEQEHASARWTAPLLLVGLAAVPDLGVRLGRARRREIALARLRGLNGVRLWAWFAGEPLLVLTAGGAAGYLVGIVLGAPAGAGLLLAAGCVAGGLVAVLAGAAASLREPLAAQVREPARPRRASPAGLFWQLLVIAAAVVALVRRGAPDDAVVLAGPALVGLALGQVAAWALGAVARPMLLRTRRSGLVAFLTARRLARADRSGPVRVLVAAAVVCGLALSGAHATHAYTDRTARLDATAGYQFSWRGARALDALRLTRDLDPHGRYLMAAMRLTERRTGDQRLAFVDTRRFAAVAGDTLRGTPAAALVHRVSALRTRPVSLFRGGRLDVRLTGISPWTGLPARATARRIDVTFDYVGGDDAVDEAVAHLRLAPNATSASASLPLKACARACSAFSLALTQEAVPADRWAPGGAAFDATVRVRVGSTDLLGEAWAHDADTANGYSRVRGRSTVGTRSGGAIRVHVAQGAIATFVPAGAKGALPVVTTGPGKRVDVAGAGGDDRAGRPTSAPWAALPLLRGQGSLLDLPSALDGASATPPEAQVLVLARAGTPSALLARVRARAGQPRTLAQIQRQVAGQAGAGRVRAYLVLAGSCVLVGLAVAVAWAMRRRTAFAAEVAALRVIGVPPAVVGRSARRELLAVGVTALIAALAGWAICVRELLARLPLVRPLADGIALPARMSGWPAVAVAVVVAAGLLVLARARRTSAPETRPAVLREGAEP